MINHWVQLKSNLRIDCDNEINWFSKMLPDLGRIHKVIEETETEIKVKTVWIDKAQILKMYGANKPDAAFVF